MTHAGWLALIPALSAIIFALLFHKTFEALLGASVLGFLMLWIMGRIEEDPFTAFVYSLQGVMADEVIVWIILVVGLFGSLIALLVKSGGALAFGELVCNRVKSRRGGLLVTWLLGLVIFIDDYLNALTVGSAMRRVTDKFKVSREMLAYVVDSTAAPVCVLLPFSTWALFSAGLLVENGVAAPGQGLTAYIWTIPFNLYAIACLVMVFLVAMGIVPAIGPMKRAEERAAAGQPIPDGAEEITLLERKHESVVPASDARLYNFVIPIAVLILASWLPGTDIPNGVWIGEIDAIKGVISAVVVTSILFLIQRLTSPAEFSDCFFSGMRSMVYPLAIVVMSFVLVEVNDNLGLTTFVVESVRGWMGPALLPAVAFLTMGFVAFITGSYWGMYAISLPIIIPVAGDLGANQWLAIGAVLSAGAFGSHLCPFGDATVLSSAGSGCGNLDHVRTQMPYGLICAAVATVLYLILGVVL
ncbi:MAG: sodium:proton antiporter [Candidatus Sumerlaeia bacterium]|nr:sodium:proton antiporter [Candidatus Sumerlaeia bacterium]